MHRLIRGVRRLGRAAGGARYRPASALTVVVCFALFSRSDAAAQDGVRRLELSRLAGSEDVTPLLDVFADADGGRSLADVRSAHGALKFEPKAGEREVALGFSESAVWLRWEVQNSADRESPWVLELAEPTLDDVLDDSKMEAGRIKLTRSTVELDLLVREVVDQMCEHAARKEMGVAVELRAEPVLAQMDSLRLKQVLFNLLGNAIKFSHRGGRIAVRQKLVSDMLSISVIDRGIGIAPEDHERIFTRFEQVEQGDTRRYGGTGLGITISRSLVRMHGGDIRVSSMLGQGATFTVRLPRGVQNRAPLKLSCHDAIAAERAMGG
jgi:anti-sigma regulatory factor (Ser/Thr protein kinase)